MLLFFKLNVYYVCVCVCVCVHTRTSIFYSALMESNLHGKGDLIREGTERE